MIQESMEAPKKKKDGAGLLILLGVGLAALLLGTKKAGAGPGPGPGPGPEPSPTFTSLLLNIAESTTLEQLELVKAAIEAANAQGLLTLAEYQALLDAYLAKKAALTGGTTPPPPTGPLLTAGALVVT